MAAEVKYPHKSRFGTHKEMVVREEGNNVVCADEFGEYTTPKDRVDNGLADPNRYAVPRLGKLFAGHKTVES